MCWHSQKILSPSSVTASSGHNGLRPFVCEAVPVCSCLLSLLNMDSKKTHQSVPGVIYHLAGNGNLWISSSQYLWRQTCKMDCLRFNSHTTVFTLSDAFLASCWLQHRRCCSGDINWSAGTRYLAKLPFCSNISVDVRVAAQLSAGRPI